MNKLSDWYHNRWNLTRLPGIKFSLPGHLGRVFWFSTRRFAADQHSQRAIALTYYTLFAIVPVAALVFGIAKGFAFQERLKEVLAVQLVNHQDVLEWVYQFADTTLREARGGVVAGVGVVALIWTVMWLASNIEKAFNAIWGLPNRKNIFRRLSDYLSILLLTPLALAVMSSAGVLVRGFIERMMIDHPLLNTAGSQWIVGLSIDVFPVLVVCFIFSMIYFVVPNTRVKIGSALFGGVVAGVLFQLLQDSFLFLQSELFRYNKIYGGFAALPLFLIWMQWSWLIALFGAEVSFVNQNLGTGLFTGPQERKLSLRLRREYELAIASMLYRRFAAGRGPMSEKEIIAELPLPPAMLESLLAEMVESGVLLVADRPDDDFVSFAPGRSPEGYTVCDAMAQLNENGLDSPLANTDFHAGKMRKLLTGMRRENLRSESNQMLKNL
ncbi:MAG: YihY/virulence factor BrkB family protein [Victivallaceae bacterium]|nr:YihY/virulence factor BrkB family protein [Victivallaceae bacterium]